LRVVTANVLFANSDREGFLRWLERESPDVLAVQELSREWQTALDDLRAFYPHHIAYPQTPAEWEHCGFALALFTRFPVESQRACFARDDSLPVLELVVRIGDRRVTLRTAHPASPQTNELWLSRNDYLAQMARKMNWDGDCILLADVNASSGSPIFADLIDATSLHDSRRGFGRLPTWQTDTPIAGLWVDLDHILVGDSFCVLERATSAVPGSDHLAATATLTLRAR
jgi:endonuclease/exonuclease/phosphatase (EEP) superfamily protein YafD